MKIFQRVFRRSQQNPPNPAVDQKSVALEVFSDYCNNTSLHGIGYLGSKDKNLVEKVWWVIAFVVSVCCCAYLITRTWNKWETSPVILSFEHEQTPIWAIPFPAITICPTVKIDKDKYDFASKFKRRENLTDEEYKKFWDIALICHLELYDGKVNVSGKSNFTDDEALASIYSASRTLEDTIFEIRWQNVAIKDEHKNAFFSNQLTEDGLCFTFNSFSQMDMYTNLINNNNNVYIDHNKSNEGWNLETGYPKNSSSNTYPKRTANDGYLSGLTLYLYTNMLKTDYTCGWPVTGYKIMLHNPAETPRPNEQYILASIDRQHAIIVTPQLTTTDEALHNLNSGVRKCLIQKEKSLQYFKIYTQNNCKTECFANITKHHCGCIPFYIPHDNDTKICGFGKNTCITNLQTKVLLFEIKSTEDVGLTDVEKKILAECNCLPSCSDLQFTTENSQAEGHIVKLLNHSGLLDDEPEFKKVLNQGVLKLTEIDIFFKQKQFLALHRSELFGRTEFLASIGGLLGLFMGFSFLSLLEIIYFMTVFWYCKYTKPNEVESTKC